MRSKRVRRLLAVVLALVAGSSSAQTVPHKDISVGAGYFIEAGSLRADPPLVTYRVFLALAGGRYSAGVAVNCDVRTRRESADPASRLSPEGSSDSDPWRAVFDGSRQAAELNLACDLGRQSFSIAGRQPPAPIPAPPAPPAAVVPPTLPPSPPAAVLPRQTASGSGFLVARARVVTNHHVVDGCDRVLVRQGDETVEATVIGSSPAIDLVLLNTLRSLGASAPVRAAAHLGEEVVVAGYPLSGLLGDDLIVTSGQVNSLVGIRNDPMRLQVSAPVQAGNSGGPLIDRTGAVVGVVVSKLNVDRVSKVTGDVAQNVNFGIKPEMLRLFLDAHRVSYRSAVGGARLDGAQIAQAARQFTVQVLCEARR